MVSALAGLVWPQRCPGCGRVDVLVCAACLARVVRPAFRAPVRLDIPCWAVTTYDGVARRLIIAWKERGGRTLTRPLAHALTATLHAAHEATTSPTPFPSAHALAAYAPAVRGVGHPLARARGEGLVVVPVPASRRGRRERGTDLIADLVRDAVRAPGVPPLTVLPALTHRRRVQDQSGLTAARRRANLRGALTVRRRYRTAVNGRRVLVVDDIVTTGATVTEAVRALTASGAHVVGICCLSVTLRHQRMPDRRSLH